MEDMKLQQMVYALMGQQPGMAGTQGGAVDERPIMEDERALQGIAGAGMRMAPWWAMPSNRISVTCGWISCAQLTSVPNGSEWASDHRLSRLAQLSQARPRIRHQSL